MQSQKSKEIFHSAAAITFTLYRFLSLSAPHTSGLGADISPSDYCSCSVVPAFDESLAIIVLVSPKIEIPLVQFSRAEYSEYNTINYLDLCKNMLGFLITYLILCCIGIPLNGIVIWLLGFQIKRNPFTVLILNLAIADFGLLVSLAIFCTCFFVNFSKLIIPCLIMFCLSHVMYINGIFLLAAISIDRCVCVFFPIWHRCSRPKYLSPIVCAFLWVFSFLFVGIANIMEFVFKYRGFSYLHLVVTAVLCLPLIAITTLILFFKICLKPKQIKRGRMLVMILITLLCFLIFNLPLNIYGFIAYTYSRDFPQTFAWYQFIILGASLNSSVNPVIYYLVGRKRRAQTRESIKIVFQRVFKEDEAPESREKSTNTVSTPL
ncbi:mas-related G-protein coupled receptor member H-like [Thamnophis elegans]|uniref:mas-related G-protein coupled receptor member H-like n=1 Tax=Thamnophis elegans TaxID=35005 RepID=UPI001378EE40|nr:mas-related G-protein coupled receptor member H-like [Thamnophis elegans]